MQRRGGIRNGVHANAKGKESYVERLDCHLTVIF